MMDPLYHDKPIPFCTGVTMIRSGEWRSTVPSEAVVTGRLGIAPSESIDDAVLELEDAIMSTANADPWLRKNPPKINYFPSLWQSGQIEPDHPLVKIIGKNSIDITGKGTRIGGMSGCSDSGTLIKVGNVPTVNFGPNSMDVAHQNDEYIDLDSLFKCTDIIAQTIVDFCGIQE
jgi:acetylornithine deacetylase